MVKFPCNTCALFSVPHLWIQDTFWCLILVAIKILSVERGKDKLRSCANGAEESEAKAFRESLAASGKLGSYVFPEEHHC